MKIILGKTKSKKEIIILIDQEEGLSSYYYKLKYKVEDFNKIGKVFRLCDTPDDVIKCIDNLITFWKNGDRNYEFHLSRDSEETINLNIKCVLLTGSTELIEIKLNSVLKDVYLLNEYLIQYIKKLKEKSGIKRLLSHDSLENSFPFNESSIVKSINDIKFIEDNIKIKELKSSIKYKLLFNSEVNGDKASEFHRLVDNHKPILFFIETEEKIKFGGYTSLQLNGSSTEVIKEDNKCFCFNLNKNKIFNVKKGENVICCTSNNCFFFYNGKSDIIAVKNLFLNCQGSTCSLNYSSFDGMTMNYELNNGKPTYKITKLEVFSIIFDNVDK